MVLNLVRTLYVFIKLKENLKYGNINTINKKKTERKKHHKDQTKALVGCPQRSGVCLRVFTASPKKPNSAVRKVTKVKLSTGRAVTVGIPAKAMIYE